MQLLQDLRLPAGPQTLCRSPHSCSAAAGRVCAGLFSNPLLLAVAAAAAAIVRCCEGLGGQTRSWMGRMLVPLPLSAGWLRPGGRGSFGQLAGASLAPGWLCSGEGRFQLPQREGGEGVGTPEGMQGMPGGQDAADEAWWGEEAGAGLGGGGPRLGGLHACTKRSRMTWDVFWICERAGCVAAGC